VAALSGHGDLTELRACQNGKHAKEENGMNDQQEASKNLDENLRLIYSAIATLNAEAEYIRNELPRFAEAPEIVAALEKITEELVGTYFDLRSEFREILEKIDPDVVSEDFHNRDPRINLQHLDTWFFEAMGNYHALVKEMEKKGNDGLPGLATMLLMSCGTNLLNSNTALAKAKIAIEIELSGES
jgi:hypothetical protein